MRGDPLEIELLLLNVMKNAAEAVQGLPDGAVLVKFRRETLPSPLAENPSPSPAAPSAEAVIVEVEDNGPRLSDEAFERLTRVSQSVKDEGLGLGLGIVRSLVEARDCAQSGRRKRRPHCHHPTRGSERPRTARYALLRLGC